MPAQESGAFLFSPGHVAGGQTCGPICGGLGVFRIKARVVTVHKSGGPMGGGGMGFDSDHDAAPVESGTR